MSTEVSARLHSIPTWMISLCRAIGTWRGFLWSNLVGLGVNLLATWLVTSSDTDYSKDPLIDIARHWFIYVPIFLGIEALLGLISVIGRLPELKKPLTRVKREYLNSVIDKTEKLRIEGMPMVYARVALDEIFIPPHVKPHQSNIDQLLTPESRRRLREGIAKKAIAEEVEQVLIQAEHDFAHLVNQNEGIGLDELWKGLTRDEPAAVIQGTPGMGKSTLLLRLALYMARQSKGEKDEIGNQPLLPALTPLFISLGQYATYRQKTNGQKEKSVRAYLASLPAEMNELGSPDTINWLERELSKGRCLVLFDALDEVSNTQERFDIQNAIKDFITDARSQAEGRAQYNRFLITSRVAGYDPNAFAYPHYTLAELTIEQIKKFLPRWCQASARRDLQNVTTDEKRIARQASLIEQDLLDALENHQGVREMAENPFLLTLLAIMRQNGISLPHRRIELYKSVTRILLVDRNVRRNLPEIPEEQAFQRLGPIAYQMQASKNSFMALREVQSAIMSVLINDEHIPAEQASIEAHAFLERVRERGGIFVFRAGDFLGFFHRTFQEYFAARYLLALLATNPVQEKQALPEKARQKSDDLWREPFLLALAYKNSERSLDAHEILLNLLQRRAGDDREQRAHDVLLVGQCMVEAKASTLLSELEQQGIQALLEIYEEALAAKDNPICQSVEQIMASMLGGISDEAEHSMILKTLLETLQDTQHLSRLHALLILLAQIGPQLERCAAIVFDKLVPPLLGLACLPARTPFKPITPLSAPTYETQDGALGVLSFLGTRGPAGAAQEDGAQRFGPYLEQLATYSLESGLITPTLVPSTWEKYAQYEKAIEHWLKLKQQKKRRKDQDRGDVVAIQRELLQAAEELCYPADSYLLEMLERSRGQADWQVRWQEYLRERMEKGSYQDYQICAILWAILFPDQVSQRILIRHLEKHFGGAELSHHFSRRFLLNIVRDLRNLRDSRNSRNSRNSRDLENLRNSRNLIDLENLITLRNLIALKYLIALRNLEYLVTLEYLEYLGEHIFIGKLVKEIERQLGNCWDAEECIDLLTLLMGRILQIQESKDMRPEVIDEIQHIVSIALPFRAMNDKMEEVVLDLIEYLPARTKQEVAFILQLARDNQDESTRKACAKALRRANLQDEEAKTELQAAQTSSIDVIQIAATERLAELERLANR